MGLACALLAPQPLAAAIRSDQQLLAIYARARAADSLGAAERAALDYSIALASAPGNQMLASRALTQAVLAGNLPLAVKAARVLEGGTVVAPDARFVLLVEAVRGGDWRKADVQIASIERDEVFSFMAPVMRAWAAFGARNRDPLRPLSTALSDPLALSYVAEHRPLLLLAMGREKEGLEALGKLIAANNGRAYRVQLSAAARLARGSDRERTLEWLRGDSEPLVDARQRVQQGKPLGGAIDTAPEGLAEFLLAMAIDLRRQDVTALALSFARLATFLAPDDSEAWLIVGSLLAAQNQKGAALAALDHVGRDDPLADAAADARIRLLTASGDATLALKQAEKAARGKAAGASDWIRLGDLYDELGRHREAAEAYTQARSARRDASATPEWTLWLLRGGSLLRAGNWPDAKASLEAAYKLAPDQPVVLNYLGYAQLERRENMIEAEKLIRAAKRLDPESPQITDSLGWARYLQGDLAKAIELLEAAVRGEPADPAINEHLGDAYFSAGRRYEARYAWSAALVSAERKDAERIRAKLETGLAPELAAP